MLTQEEAQKTPLIRDLNKKSEHMETDDVDNDFPKYGKDQDSDEDGDDGGDDEDIDGNAEAIEDLDFDAGDISVADLIDKIRRGPYSKAFRPYHYSYSTPFAGRSRKLSSGKKGIPRSNKSKLDDDLYNFDDVDDDLSKEDPLDEYDEESDREDDRPRFDYQAHFNSFFTDDEDESDSDEDEEK